MMPAYYRDGEECVWDEHLGQTGDDGYWPLPTEDADLLDSLYGMHIVSADEDRMMDEAYLEDDLD